MTRVDGSDEMLMLHRLALAVVMACARLTQAATVADLSAGQEGKIEYPSSAESVTLTGTLSFPSGAAGRVPAIVIAHGSGGLDARSWRWASFFQTQGIATFTIDYFGPRGVWENSAVQPIPLRDARDALNLLATHPRIDPKRIAIIGFSRGGHLAWESANAPRGAEGEPRYAAHIALYPSCATLGVGREGLSAPVMLQVGELDDAVPVVQCELLAERAKDQGASISLKIYAGGYHGWDGNVTRNYYQRSINRSYRLQADEGIAKQSREDAIGFLQPLIGPFAPAKSP